MLERHDIATGATGRNHGLLHSGSRYAVTDRESAEECIKENMILKRIASHCVEKTDGLFLTLPEDDIAYQAKFIESCQAAGINAQAIDPKEALRKEPSANSSIIGAVTVPDGTVDPFRLTLSNILDAKEHGAEILTYHEVLGLIKEQNRVIGVKVYDHKSKEEKEIYGTIIVNASGIWGQKIAEYADLKVKMFPAKGALLIFGHRVNKMVLNRCRKPADADILVPGDTICLIGTTSTHVPYDEIDNMYVTPEEVDILIREGGKLAPILLQTRILRAYAGVRPLVASDDDPSGRNVSRGIVLLDHEIRDGLEGFITITGGKLMTYRLMAEWATDLICKKLNNTAPCTTALTNLPGSRQSKEEINKKIIALPSSIRKSAIYRMGDRAENLSGNTITENSLVCECEEVSAGEVEYAVKELHVNNLIDLRRRTRVGMGTCQGELCACRAAGLMNHYKVSTTERSRENLSVFLNERWKGIRPIAWGDTLRESEFTNWVYEGVCGLSLSKEQIKKAKNEI
jgi:glycerol-3-phosphate dehydrogenase